MSLPPASHDAENAGADTRSRPKAILTAIFCGFAALLPIVSVIAPKGLVILLLLAVVLAVPAYWLAHRRFPVPELRTAIVLALLVVWCAIASSWSFDVGQSLVLALRIAVIFAAGIVLFPVAAGLDGVARARVGRWMVGGFVLILALMVVEVGLGYPAIRSFKEVSSGREAIALNRGVIAMSLIVWPMVAYLWGRGLGWKSLVVPVLLGIASTFLESAAATLGFAAGVAAFLLVVSHRKAGRVVTLAACVVALVATPFTVREMHNHEWHRADWLSGSERHRVEIWNFSVERIVERPLLGWGFDSSRYIGEIFFDAGEASPRIVSLHPHNAPLQIMLELGAIGAVIALALLWLIAIQLNNLSRRTRECGQAMFIAALAIGCVAFGQWQNWWLALIFSVALLVPLTAAPAARGDASQLRQGQGA